ncbi:hypothetical protein [Celeribacter arenosi]|uniref:Cobalt chelatase n=1 Tax=Celeribacter arenosi TaxID=792649 RepID=A0ABP7JZM2_9RHOB
MDYKKMGGPKKNGGAPRHGEHKVGETPAGKPDPKAELLARMKKAAEARKG